MGIVEQPIRLSADSRIPWTGFPSNRHLAVERVIQPRERKCLHDLCPKCHGTGDTGFGACIHMISCPCPMCTVRC